VVLRAAQVGMPFLSRPVDSLFGAIVPVPDTDEDGKLLSSFSPAVSPTDYWFAEPFSTNVSPVAPYYHTNSPYYWSPHSRAVFAIQAGPIDIVWKKQASVTTRPTNFKEGVTHHHDGGNYYALLTTRNVISGSASPAPRTIYWTEGVFKNTGQLVPVPAGRVAGVSIVYNNNVPEHVVSEHVEPGQTSRNGNTGTNAVELRTLWLDQTAAGDGQIHAYNREGRVFLELLGESAGTAGQRVSLAREIVDVVRQPNPVDVVTELGERMGAFPDGRDDSALTARPVVTTVDGGRAKYLASTVATHAALDFYAIRETLQKN